VTVDPFAAMPGATFLHSQVRAPGRLVGPWVWTGALAYSPTTRMDPAHVSWSGIPPAPPRGPHPLPDPLDERAFWTGRDLVQFALMPCPGAADCGWPASSGRAFRP
jgi:hypothetical protein